MKNNHAEDMNTTTVLTETKTFTDEQNIESNHPSWVNDGDDLKYEGNYKNHFVYHRTVDLPLPTRYVFEQPWNVPILRMRMKNGEIVFEDNEGRPVLCFENDEQGYHDWNPKNK